MLEGMYAAASGMNAQQQQIDAIGNDLANASTDRLQGRACRLSRPALQPDRPGRHHDVSAGAGAAAETIGANQSQGSIQSTGDPWTSRSKAPATSPSSTPMALPR